MSQPEDDFPIELHILSPCESNDNVDLLAMVAHYHRTAASVNLGHSVNLGRPWFPQSQCTRALISLPYVFGPELEDGPSAPTMVRFLWLLPITERELQFAKLNGLQALEERFERAGLNYLDPMRPSVI
jgi:hypothetical protein